MRQVNEAPAPAARASVGGIPDVPDVAAARQSVTAAREQSEAAARETVAQ